MGRYLVAAVGLSGAFLLAYRLAVRTVAGQRFENAVLDGRAGASPEALQTAQDRLDQVTVSMLAASMVALLVVGVLRRRVLLGVAAAGVVAGSLFLAEVLKRVVLSRPRLVDAPGDIAENSFPSGHTTIAVALMVAAVLVVPYGLRPLTALVVAAWGVGVSGFTVTAGWHRPSDTVGADLLVLVVACLVAATLVALGRTAEIAPGDGARAVLRSLVVAPIALVAVVGLGLGGLLGAYAWHQLRDPAVDAAPADHNAYLAGQSLAVGASAAAVVVMLVLLHHVDLGARRDEDEAESPAVRPDGGRATPPVGPGG